MVCKDSDVLTELILTRGQRHPRGNAGMDAPLPSSDSHDHEQLG
jgi:hypothetical protein